MAGYHARKRRTVIDDGWREKIQTSMIINRLNTNALGKLEPEMTASQLKSAEILLRKIVPDLQQVQQTTEINVNYVARIPQPKPQLIEWQAEHDNLKPVN